jgi:hypothetical protein
MLRSTVIAALGCLSLSAAAARFEAHAGAQEDGKGRYTMSPVEGGVLRLDKETGAMALCTRRNEKLVCDPVDDHARVDDGQLAKLEAENRALRDRVKALEESAARGDTAKAPEVPENKMQLPTEEEIDKALDYAERMFKKFRDRLQKADPSQPKPKPGDEGAL